MPPSLLDTDAFDLRRELLAAFEGEYREHVAAMHAVLDNGDVAGVALRDVFRRAHSLKGAARAVELPRIEQIAHDLETLLFASVEAARALPAGDVAAVRRGLDRIEAGMREDAPGAEPETQEANEPLQPAATPADPASRVSSQEIERLVDSVQAASDAMLGQELGRQWLSDHRAGLRRLVRLCEENQNGNDGDIARGLRALLQSTNARLRDGRREDWHRELTVSTLRAQVERVALVQAESVFGPLAAMARELGREQGGEIDVQLSGLGLLADRSVLQALRDPMIQLLRNAVAHGLGAHIKAASGEPPALRLTVAIRAGQLEVAVEDNGAGPSLTAIEQRARQQGLIPAGKAIPDEAALLALVFEPGFSTADAVDRLSGRGMGLSIVAEAAGRLGGSASMRPVRASDGQYHGTRVSITVPLAARRQALLMVEAGSALVALPADAVARLHRLPAGAIEHSSDGWRARIEPEHFLPVRPLGALLGTGAEQPEGETALIVALKRPGDDAQETGLLVDQLREVTTLVVRPAALVGLDRRFVGGIALRADNRPVLVLEPSALAGAGWTAPAPSAGTVSAGSRSSSRRPTILVVDDSITTRTLEKTILQAQGFAVLIAVDGLEALDVLRASDAEIDVVVADVEMPRLDGFGLVAAIRADPALARKPVVLMTSRNDETDIRRGLDLGANAYLTKQEFEQGKLLAVIGQLLP